MTSFSRITLLAAIACLASSAVSAADHGSEAEVQEMVKKAVALVKSVGPEKAYKAFTEHPDGAFKHKDLYVFAYDFNGECIAQGANPKMVGKNLLSIKDVDGNAFVKGMIDLVKASGKGWYGPYKFNNPATQTYELKKSYCERGAGDTMLCVGTYFEK
ncbi:MULTISPECIES: cache domain-containing protein [unclassified Undibacterium]|uniref:cache domain-containing protein n=1 Tax=unclassified Undibacterium TaxID=2630295 RepID=UPI002AC9ED80|nr:MULTISPECIES: cache domain-containing protein [unclassified Undibacterium]MEB0138631.1 cache domain-containing protein [Undibacterium sp. CCC2.1]MEB0171432.1 cache domain-containing protein [Undibacterium sp. CCC1.1]MEB0175762.1 cache domain-containing protein [Undibacterium sp. CCC3.4]MEB0214410.1 cache domain-containing protein [Undibacterium sp. 5I2]WPX44275.1 cache domain-containing protein [Undibacterium sp. CCC3.4]